LLYAGFMILLVGVMISATPNPFLEDVIRRLIPLNWDISFLAGIFWLVGGLVEVTGFTLCIWPAKPAPLPPPPPPTIIIQRVPEPATPKTPDATPSVPKCKFCGAPLRDGNPFCPSCQRAQA
jgi:hypothetical protein